MYRSLQAFLHGNMRRGSNFVSKPFERSGVEIFTVLKDTKRNNEIESKIKKYILDKNSCEHIKTAQHLLFTIEREIDIIGKMIIEKIIIENKNTIYNF